MSNQGINQNQQQQQQPFYGSSNPPVGSSWQQDPVQVGFQGAEAEMPKHFAFDDASIRRGFIRKVYSILMVQLLVTFGAVALFNAQENARQFAMHNIWLLFVAIIVTLISLCSMICVEGLRRQAPTNFIILSIFTIAESYVVARCTLRYSPSTVLLAVGITAAVCLALTLFAFQTKYDFTMLGGILLAAGVVFLIFSILRIFIHVPMFNLAVAAAGALLFSIYLVYDTQMMMGGDHRCSISPEEYIFASLNLYMDIINLFLQILALLGGDRD